MSDSDERELRAGLRSHFAERADESAAPPFARVWGAARARAAERASERRGPWTAAAAGTAALALARILAVAFWPSPSGDPEPELRALLSSAAAHTMDWEAPLDFLRTTPGLELIETTPSFGEPEEEETNAEGAQSSRPRERTTT